MRTRKDVVLGRGVLGIYSGRLDDSVWLLKKDRESCVKLRGIAHRGERGTLLWRPDPPKSRPVRRLGR